MKYYTIYNPRITKLLDYFYPNTKCDLFKEPIYISPLVKSIDCIIILFYLVKSYQFHLSDRFVVDIDVNYIVKYDSSQIIQYDLIYLPSIQKPKKYKPGIIDDYNEIVFIIIFKIDKICNSIYIKR